MLAFKRLEPSEAKVSRWVPRGVDHSNVVRLLGSLLIHGARSAVRAAAKKTDYKSNWIKEIQQRRGNNIAAVALANKTVRTIWAMLKNDMNYELNHNVIAA